MEESNERTVTRDIPSTLIPYGDDVTIPEGTQVVITHRLGGNFTVQWAMGMCRVSGEHGDALGEEAQNTSTEAAEDDHSGPPEEQELWNALKTVYDPEIPVNIVDLGLVYTMEVNEREDEGFGVAIKMTLTAPGCGMGPAIAQDAEYKMSSVPGVRWTSAEIVWDPPWNQDMISEEGKMMLGMI